MKHHFILLITLHSTLLSACAPTPQTCDEVEECTICEQCPINRFPEGLVLPQIYIQRTLFWSENELLNLQGDVNEAIIECIEDQDYTVISTIVKNATKDWYPMISILVDVIVSTNNAHNDPLYYGVLIRKVDGVFPRWKH